MSGFAIPALTHSDIEGGLLLRRAVPSLAHPRLSDASDRASRPAGRRIALGGAILRPTTAAPRSRPPCQRTPAHTTRNPSRKSACAARRERCSHRLMSQIGPYSRPATLAKLDGRTRESRLMQTARAELSAHVGGKPSAVQRRLIDRACMSGPALGDDGRQGAGRRFVRKRCARVSVLEQRLCPHPARAGHAWRRRRVPTLAELFSRPAAAP